MGTNCLPPLAPPAPVCPLAMVIPPYFLVLAEPILDLAPIPLKFEHYLQLAEQPPPQILLPQHPQAQYQSWAMS